MLSEDRAWKVYTFLIAIQAILAYLGKTSPAITLALLSMLGLTQVCGEMDLRKSLTFLLDTSGMYKIGAIHLFSEGSYQCNVVWGTELSQTALNQSVPYQLLTVRLEAGYFTFHVSFFSSLRWR